MRFGSWSGALAAPLVVGASACGLIISSGEISGRVSPDAAGGAATSTGTGGAVTSTGTAGGLAAGGSGGKDTGNDTCETAIDISLGMETITRHGSSVGPPGSMSAGTACAAAAGPERIYRVKVLSTGFLTVRLVPSGTSFDSVLYLSNAQGCDMPSDGLLCEDRAGGSGEVASVDVQVGHETYAIVDGSGKADEGDYTISFTLSTGMGCGHEIPITLEPGSNMELRGDVPKAGVAHIACPGGAGDTTPDVAYLFSPPNQMKTITVTPDNGDHAPLLIDSDGCPSIGEQCVQAGPGEPVTIKTKRDHLWVHGGTTDNRYTLTVSVP